MSGTQATDDPSTTTRAAILTATRLLMVEEGHAAVSTRKVATRAGVKPALVQHYFRKMDDLLLTVYQQAAERAIDRQKEALLSARPLSALWDVSRDAAQTVLALEFMALARHRPSIRAEIIAFQERARGLHAGVIRALLSERLDVACHFDAEGIAALLIGAAHALVMEENLGLTTGHSAADEMAAQMIRQLEVGDVQ